MVNTSNISIRLSYRLSQTSTRPAPTSASSAKRRCQTDFRASPQRPHHQRVDRASLATRTRAHRVQTHDSGLPSVERLHTQLPQRVSTSLTRCWPPPSALRGHTPAHRPHCQTVDRRKPRISGRWRCRLEQATCQCCNGPSVDVFKHRLKTYLFNLSFPGLVT
jgi:hypothetical protein